MSVSDYSLRLAEKHVEEYRDKDAIISRHEEAMECCDCEDFLQLGIEACKWLRRADRTLRQAAVKGFDVPPEARDALAKVYRFWLLPCPHAEERIKQQKSRGFTLGNLKDFQEACEHVKQQVRLLGMEEQLESAFQGGVFGEQFWHEAKKMRSA
jgi:hypothetical protein